MIVRKKELLNYLENQSLKTYAISKLDINGKWALLVSHEMSGTGAPIELVYFAEELRNAGMTPLIISMEDGPLSGFCEEKGIPVIIYPNVYKDRLVDSVLYLMTMVVVNTIAGGPLIRKLNGCGHEIIWWIHESESSYSREYLIQLPVELEENIHIFCVGEYAVKALLKRRPKYSTAILPVCVPDESRTYKEHGSHFPEKEGRTVFLHAGTLMVTKGQDVLLKAIERLPEEMRKKAVFVFIGKKYDKAVQENIEKAGRKYPGSIRLLDEVGHGDMHALYHQADCCLCTSRSESMSLTMIEAMMHSRIVICTDNAGVSEYIRDGKCGLLYHGNDVDGLAARISEVIEHKASFEYMGENARKTYSEYFDRRRFSANIRELIADYSQPEEYIRKYGHISETGEDGETERSAPLFSVIITGSDGSDGTAFADTERALSEQLCKDWEPAGKSGISGRYTVVVKAGTILREDCLARFAGEIRKSSPDVLYSDHEVVPKTEGAGIKLYKPDYAPDTLRSGNYIGPVYAFRNAMTEDITGTAVSRPLIEQDPYYALLVLTAAANKVGHIPEVLYETEEADDFERARDKAALSRFLASGDFPGTVEEIDGTDKFRIRYEIKRKPLISIIICNRDHCDDLKKCIESIRTKTTYPDYEIIIVDNGSEEKDIFDYYEQLHTEGIRVLFYRIPFNYSKLNNYAAEYAGGEYIVFLNNDMEVITPSWLEEMLMYGQRPDVGIVGAKLLLADDTIQHAGVIIGMYGSAGHIFEYAAAGEKGYDNRLTCVQNFSAVTAACVMIRASLFRECGKFDEEFTVTYNDTDLCLRIREEKKLIVWTPFAKLYHYESKSRGYDHLDARKIERCAREVEKLTKRWEKYYINGDPYYNPHFDLTKNTISEI